MFFYLIVVIGILACSASQILLKKSADIEYNRKISILFNWRVMLSYSIFFISLVTNIIAMKNGVGLKDLPILEATGYIFVPLLSMFFLSEKITKNNIIAICLIIIGIVFFFS